MAGKNWRGKVRFEDLFLSVSFCPALLDYGEIHHLGPVFEADCEHDNRPRFRLKAVDLPQGVAHKGVVLVKPVEEKWLLADILAQAASFGFRPALHYETAHSLLMADPEDLQAVYDLLHGLVQSSGKSLGGHCPIIINPGTFVQGKKGELTSVHEIRMDRKHVGCQFLRLVDASKPLFLGQMVSLVSVE